jgi:DNA-binding MarR family transcriptional regulator
MAQSDQRSVLQAANQLHSSVARLFHRLRVTRAAGGLSIAKLAVLSLLHRQGVATATDLAGCLGIQPQSLTRLLAESEKQGLIKRRPDHKDKRQSLIQITATGTRVLANEAHRRERRLAAAMIRVLTPAEQQLVELSGSLMDRLADAIEPDQQSPTQREAGQSP